MYEFKEGDKVRVVNKFLQGSYSHYNDQWKGYWHRNMDKYVNSGEIGQVVGESDEGILVNLKHSDGSNVRWYFPSDSLELVKDNEVSEEEITLKLTKEDVQVLKSLLGMISGSPTKSYRKNTTNIFYKLSELGIVSIEDFQSFVVFDEDKENNIKCVHILPTNHKQILAIEKQIEELQSKLTTLKGE